MDDDYSSSSSSSQLKQPLSYRVADKIVGGLFSVEPIFNVLSKKARQSIIKRSEKVCACTHPLIHTNTNPSLFV
jgi:hypothetical protein